MEITDEYIINLLWPNKICLLDRCKDRLTEDIKKYLNNRYKYSESLYESLFCIKNNIDRDNLICPICHKGILKFNGIKSRGYFNQGCCLECTYKIREEHSQKTSIEKYGTKHPRQNNDENKIINKKRKQTCLIKYGVEAYTQTNEYKKKVEKTSLEKYGTKHPFQSKEVKEKIHKTCKERYNTDWTFQCNLAKEHQKQTLLKKYGVENSFCIPSVLESFKERKIEIQQKRDNTKRKNKTFGTSIPEEKTYQLLLKYFDKLDIIRQYKEIRYPFNCDFYIKSLDLFIECNYFWTHQGHLFDENNKEDINKLKYLIKESKNHPFYLGAISTWTKYDLEKKKIADENKLYYLIFWNINEIKDWLINNYGEKNN